MTETHIIEHYLSMNQAKSEGVFNDGIQTGHSITVLLIILLHAILGVLITQTPIFGLLYGILVFILGVFLAMHSNIYTLYATAYITGAELIWRISGTPIFWEFGKISILTITSIAILRSRLIKFPRSIFMMFACLLPGAIYVLFSEDLFIARDRLSATMLGPMVLIIGAVLFSSMRLTYDEIAKFLLFLLIPIGTVIGPVAYMFITQANIVFGTESNYHTSAGFGPNQVSNALSLGVVVSICLLFYRQNYLSKLVFFLVALVLLYQTVLTFSRGGVLNVVITLVFIGVLVINQRRLTGFLWILLGIAVTWLFILPFLSSLTQDMLDYRYSINTDAIVQDSRYTRMQNEFQIFIENPLGTGSTGGSANSNGLSNTEYTRILADHGILGLVFWILLLRGIVRNYISASGYYKLVVTTLITWSLVYMSHSGIRTAAPDILISYTFMRFEEIHE